MRKVNLGRPSDTWDVATQRTFKAIQDASAIEDPEHAEVEGRLLHLIYRSASLVRGDQLIRGGANVASLSLPVGSFTVDCGKRPLQYITNGGAFTIKAPINDGSVIILVTNNSSAGTITFSGFSVGSNTGDALDTTNGHQFSIQVWRINGVSAYQVVAHQ